MDLKQIKSLKLYVKAAKADIMWMEELIEQGVWDPVEWEQSTYELRQSVYLIRKAAGNED